MCKISILLPVYNGELFLRQAISSIINQTYTDWELILINDGSTDNSENIISEFDDKRIRYFKNEHNLGLIKTLNKGIDLCRGEYIARMDADDICLPKRLEKQYHFMKTNSSIFLLGSNAFIINNNNEITGKIVNFTKDNLLKINLLFSVPFIHPSIIAKASVLKELKYDENYKYAEDYELWTRISEKHNIANLSDCFLEYRWHLGNESVVNKKKQDLIKDKIIIKQLQSYLDLNPSREELYMHKITFLQYDVKGNNSSFLFEDFPKLDLWFKKIILANRDKKYYDQSLLIAFLFSRWFVLCIKQKKYSLTLKQTFVPNNINIYWQTLKIIYALSKKKSKD